MFGQDFIDRHTPAGPLFGPAFNAAVMTLANATNPRGWDVVANIHDAPTDLRSLIELNEANGRIPVWEGGSDSTVFACKEHNYAFRAWHDAVHYRFGLEFNMAGEAGVAYVQINQLVKRYGGTRITDELVEWCAVVLSEVLGQATHNVVRGEFPTDQRAFAAADVDNWRKLAAALCIIFFADDVSDEDAVKQARLQWGIGNAG